MKEAAGEANMTVITIVLIAIVLGVGTLIVTNLMNSNKKRACCAGNGGIWSGGACYNPGDCPNISGQTKCIDSGNFDAISTQCD